MHCASCQHENRDAARFCEQCGTPLAARAGAARKVVSIVFADLIGSTALHERVDPESARRFMEGYYEAMRGAVQAHGGRVTQQLGDGVKAVFGMPRVAEDDALRAVRAALEMQRRFRALAESQAALVGETGLRVAVNSGEVVANDESEIIGDPVNVAAHLQAQARDGDVVIGEATHRLVAAAVTLAPLGRFSLKGRSEAVSAWRVVSLERPAGAAATAFLGRDAELARVLAVYADAVAAPAARLAVVLGSPGLGKSRLLGELAARLGDRATVLVVQCNAAGGPTFAPLAEALRRHLGLDAVAGTDALRAAIDAVVPGDESERARVAGGIAALLAGTPAVPEETFFVVRRLLAALAAARPLVLVIDDIQWAEPLLLDLTEHLVVWGAGAPLLVLAAARPELRDVRSSLASPGGVVADVVTLAGLDAGAAARLAAQVIGAEALPAAVAGRVLATSEGNPLFLGELVRMLVNDGALRRDGDRWTTAVELADLEMPPTIQALLAARIERLREDDRVLLERAAVIGREFSRAAVANLLPREAHADLDARLESLRRSELIEPAPGWLLGEPALRFHHVLIRDAAYRRLLRNTRAALHARFAGWLEERAAGSVEHDETIGWHLEQAHAELRELGPLDAAGRALGERAARTLAAAGRRALARDDLALAAGLLGRALALLDPQDPARADLALDACEALLAAGNVAHAERALDELERAAGESARLRAWHTCFVAQRAMLSDPQALRTTTEAVAEAAATLAAAGDAAGEAKAHSVHALSLAQLGKIGACEAALDRALAAARRARDRRRANAVLAGAPVAALWGPSPVTRASGRCLDVVRVLRITQGAPAVESVALRCQAVLETLRGRADAARRMIASSRRMVEELGITQRVLETDLFAGTIELLEGDAVAAERWLRGAYEGLRGQGLDIDAAQAAALLGRALLLQGRVEEAEARSRESEALAGDSFKAAIAWRGVRAEVLAARGEHAASIECARAAVEIAAATDDLLDHADARSSLAVALRAAGRTAEADAEVRRAIELWDAKGATRLAERARERLGSSARPAATPRVEPRPAPRRRVRGNTASANATRMDAAVAARDLDAFLATLAEGAQSFHHPTGMAYSERESIGAHRRMLATENLRFEHEPIASLGDRLVLCHGELAFHAVDLDDIASVGASDMSSIVLLEVDAQGLRTRTEFFATDRFADALARLYERHAELLREGAEGARAATAARVVAAMLGPYDLERCASALAPDVVGVDHRRVGFGAAAGKQALLRGFATVFAVSDDLVGCVDDVIAASPDALLVRWTSAGTDRGSGGRFEWQFLRLLVFGTDGLLRHYEILDGDRTAEALARMDALCGEPEAPRFENAAYRMTRRTTRLFNEGKLDAILASRVPTFHQEDHRAIVGLSLSADESRVNERFIADARVRVDQARLLATRGERLALARIHMSGESGENGLVDWEYLSIGEIDEHGRSCARVMFDPSDRDAAYAELDARFAAGEGAPYVELLAQLDGFRMRSSGTRGQHRVDHLRVSPRAALANSTWIGTRDGGAFELPQIEVFAHDGRGIERLEVFGADQQGAALACFEALGAEPAAAVPYNAATRALDRFTRCWRARDWDGVVACYAPGHVMDDRRSLMRMQISGEPMLVNERMLFDLPRSAWRNELLEIRGERLALYRVLFTTGEDDASPMAVEMLDVVEVDSGGRRNALVVFDAGDLAAAREELDARERASRAGSGGVAANAATRAMQRFGALVEARDWTGLEQLLAPHFAFEDRRRGLGDTGDRAKMLASVRWSASSENRVSSELVATAGDRLALERVCFSAAESSDREFEIVILQVIEIDAQDRFVATVAFDPDAREAAESELRARHARTA